MTDNHLSDLEILQKRFDESLNRQRELVEAELKRIAIEEEAHRETQRLRVAEQRRAAAVENLLDRVGELVTGVDHLLKLISSMITQYPLSSAINELADEVRDGMELIDNKLQLLLEINRFVLPTAAPKGNGERARLTKLLDRAAIEPRIDSLQRQLARRNRTLNSLQEKAAGYGSDIPVSLTNEIEDCKKEIDQIEAELKEIEA